MYVGQHAGRGLAGAWVRLLRKHPPQTLGAGGQRGSQGDVLAGGGPWGCECIGTYRRRRTSSGALQQMRSALGKGSQ